MSMGPIPFTSILTYYQLYPVGEFEEFLYIIRKMDNTLLSELAKESNKKSADKSSKARKLTKGK